jgi:hypothetical protein
VRVGHVQAARDRGSAARTGRIFASDVRVLAIKDAGSMASTNRTILLVLGAIACVVGFHDVAKRYGDFRMWDGPPAGFEPHPLELAFDAWYFLFGGLAVGLLALAIAGRSVDVASIEARLRRLGASPWLVPGTGVFVLVASLAAKDLLLAGAPVSDDEHIYDFIAKTLALGRLKNPLPPVDAGSLQLFQTNFVVLDEHGWYGKYPIGHPIFLALGELVGGRFVVCPLLAATTAMVTVVVARRLIGDAGAAMAALLVALSPQLVLTAATNHSQNTSMTMMMLAVLALHHAATVDVKKRRPALLAAGVALGAGFLARPMPGALFVVAAVVWWLAFAPLGTESTWRTRLVDVAIKGLPIALFVGALGATNYVQAGDPFVSGYQTVHGARIYLPYDQAGTFSASIGAAVLRQGFWAFGWPISFIFVPFAARAVRERPRLALVWLLLAAGYAYRFLAPKVFVGTTGPIYVAEVVPLVAVLSVAGMVAMRRWLHDLRPSYAPLPAALAMAGTFASIAMFLPFQLAAVHQVGLPQRRVTDTLAARGVKRALVFQNNTTRYPGATWALWPPPPPPTLDEAVVYVRRPLGPDAAEVMKAFHAKYFADRPAFVFAELRDPPALYELAAGDGAGAEVSGDRR